MRHRSTKILVVSTLLAVSVVAGASATAEPPPPSGASDLDRLELPDGGAISPSLRVRPVGPVEVVVRLSRPSLADAMGPNAKRTGGRLDAPGRRAHLARISTEQDAVAARVRQLGGRELGRVDRSLNAVVAQVDAGQLEALAATPGVVSVRPLRNYELDLTDTVPYIGARSGAFSSGEVDGSGVTVAVLDSGVDYTHASLGGPGTLEAYEAAYGTSPADPRNTTRDGLFPTDKVVEGYDFVGEVWPLGPNGFSNADLAPNPDPIDLEGHGTHVADIIAGAAGVAPGASILGVKVCSAVSSACSGLALLQGMDFALDPNGDGDLSDGADVINLSLGSSYGQLEDDLSAAVDAAVRVGVTVVASAGNSADRPYIVGSPSSALGAISVAQTQVPSARAFPLNVTGITPSQINNTATVEWAPVGDGFSGEVVRLGRACPAGSIDGTNPDDPYFNENSPSGKVALVDRGACAVSLKVDRATKDGAVAVLIANNVAGDPPSFSFGGGDLPLAPTLIITQADGNRIKAALGDTGANPAVVASVSPEVFVPLVGSMVASSSRGPSMSFDSIKPDIAAPGASVSAIAGSGTGTEAFGGTSGAAPMVAGAAALLLSLDPSMDPLTVKGRLMGTGDTLIFTNPVTRPGALAPVTRIGGGEVRVDAAAATSTIAYDGTPGAFAQPSLSFGFHTVSRATTLERRLTIQNLSSERRTYTVTPTFRSVDDAATGAVTPSLPGGTTVTVRGGGTATVRVRLDIDPSRLPVWPFTFAPSQLGNGALLDAVEFDGYLVVNGGGDEIRVPWQVLPRRSADVSADRTTVAMPSRQRSVTLRNPGALDGEWSAFALTGTSGRIPRGLLPGAGDNLAAIDLKAVGVRAFPEFGVMQFAVTTWDERSHPAYPAGFEIQVDTNRDGQPDFAVYHVENVGFAASGVVIVAVENLATGDAAAFFFLDADLNSSNRVFTVPLGALGLGPSSTFDFQVLAYDNYFSGIVTDATGAMTFTPGTPRYVIDGGLDDGFTPAGGSSTLEVSAVPGGAAASPSQTGVLLMHYANPQGREATVIEVRP